MRALPHWLWAVQVLWFRLEVSIVRAELASRAAHGWAAGTGAINLDTFIPSRAVGTGERAVTVHGRNLWCRLGTIDEADIVGLEHVGCRAGLGDGVFELDDRTSIGFAFGDLDGNTTVAACCWDAKRLGPVGVRRNGLAVIVGGEEGLVDGPDVEGVIALIYDDGIATVGQGRRQRRRGCYQGGSDDG